MKWPWVSRRRVDEMTQLAERAIALAESEHAHFQKLESDLDAILERVARLNGSSPKQPAGFVAYQSGLIE